MTSYIIVSSNPTLSESYVQDFCEKRTISSFDITILDRQLLSDESSKTVKQSIGIEEVKKMQQKIFLKPLQSPEKAIIIRESHLLTIPAQNALLKVLEEPPAQTLFFLMTDNIYALLPTIQSRCQVINLQQEKVIQSPDTKKVFQNIVASLPTLSIGEAFTLAEKNGKTKEDALLFLEQLLREVREVLILKTKKNDVSVSSLMSHAGDIQKTYTTIKITNTNVRLCLENLFLNLNTL